MMKSPLQIISLLVFAAGCSTAVPPGGVGEAVAPGVRLIRGGFVEGQQPDGNTVVLRGTEGLVVIDTGRHREHTQRILDFAQDTNLPIRAVVNTHWHLDHVGGNALMREAAPGVQVYASDAIHGALDGFLANYRRQLEDAIPKSPPEQKARYEAELALIDAGRALAPDITVTSGTIRLAGRDLELTVGSPAVTAADVRVLDVASGVLIAGDLVTLPVPFLDTACPAGWKEALDEISDGDFRILVPGHGAPMTKPQFESYRSAFSNLLQCAASVAAKEQCGARWVADLGPLLRPEERPFTMRLMDYYVGLLRSAPERIERLCAD